MAINVITNLKIFLLILALCALLFLSNTQATTELYNKCEKEFWYKNQKDFKKSIKSECLKEKRHHEKRHRQYHSCNDKSYDKNVVVSRWEKFSDCRCKAALTEMGDSKGVFVCYQIAQFNKATGEFTAELSIHKKKSKDSYDVTVEFSRDVKVMNDDGEYDGVTYRTEKVPSDETNEKYYISGKIPKTESMNKVSIDRISPTDLKLTVNDEEPKDLKKNSGYAIVPYSKFVPGENFLTSNNGPSNNNDNNDPTNTPSTNDPTSPTDDGPTNPGPSNPAADPADPADPTGGPTENGPTDPSNPAADPNGPTNPTSPTDAGPTNPGPADPSNPDPADPTDPTGGPTANDGPTDGPTDPSNPGNPTDPTDPTGGPTANGPNDPTDPNGPTDGPTNPTTDGATGPTDSSNPAGPADPTDPTDPTSDSTDTDPNDSTNSDSTDPTDPTDPTPAAASIQTPEAKQEEANNGNQPSSGGVSPGAVGSIVFGVIIAIGGVFIGWNTYERLRWRRQYRRRQAAAAQQNTSLANVPDYNGYGRAY